MNSFAEKPQNMFIFSSMNNMMVSSILEAIQATVV